MIVVKIVVVEEMEIVETTTPSQLLIRALGKHTNDTVGAVDVVRIGDEIALVKNQVTKMMLPSKKGRMEIPKDVLASEKWEEQGKNHYYIDYVII